MRAWKKRQRKERPSGGKKTNGVIGNDRGGKSNEQKASGVRHKPGYGETKSEGPYRLGEENRLKILKSAEWATRRITGNTDNQDSQHK